MFTVAILHRAVFQAELFCHSDGAACSIPEASSGGQGSIIQPAGSEHLFSASQVLNSQSLLCEVGTVLLYPFRYERE